MQLCWENMSWRRTSTSSIIFAQTWMATEERKCYFQNVRPWKSLCLCCNNNFSQFEPYSYFSELSRRETSCSNSSVVAGKGVTGCLNKTSGQLLAQDPLSTIKQSFGIRTPKTDGPAPCCGSFESSSPPLLASTHATVTAAQVLGSSHFHAILLSIISPRLSCKSNSKTATIDSTKTTTIATTTTTVH